MRTILFILAHSAVLFGLAALSYAIGRKLTRKYQYCSKWERLAICTSLGLGAISYLIFALCLLHWLYPATVLGTLGFVAIWSFSALRSLATELTAFLRTSWRQRHLLGIGIGAVVIFLPAGLVSLYPPYTAWDATMYHLPVAKLYVQHHGFVFAPHVRFSLFPQLTEMLFTLMLALFDDIAAQLVSFLMLVVTVVALCGLGRRLFSARVGHWAAVILLGNPMVAWLGSVAYIDMSLTLFVTMALYACWNWMRDRAQQWLVLAAIFAGFAAGTKYSGLFFLGLVGIVVFWHGVHERRYAPSLMFVALAAVIAAPWYARSFYYTGNPVFPFLPRIFGYGFFTPQDVADLVYDLHDHYGIGRRLPAFISLPWHLAFNQRAFNAEAVGDRGFYLLMPVLIAFSLKDARIRALCTVAFAYIVFWFFSSQETRYLLPVFPIISLSMAAALDSVLGWVPLVRRWSRPRVIVAALVAALSYPAWVFTAYELRVKLGPLPVTQEQRDQFFSRHLPSYPAYKLLNTLKGRNYALYALGDLRMVYFCDGTYMGDVIGPARYSRIRSRLADSQSLYRELRSLGADYLLLAEDADRLHEDEFFHKHFVMMYAHPPVVLFEITRTTVGNVWQDGNKSVEAGPRLDKIRNVSMPHVI